MDLSSLFDTSVRYEDEGMDEFRSIPTGWYNVRCEKSELKKYKDAIECFDKVLELEPNNKIAYSQKVLAMELRGTENLEKVSEGVLKVDPSSIEILSRTAVSFVHQGDFIKAISYFDRALEIDRNNDIKVFTPDERREITRFLQGSKPQTVNN